MQSSDYLKDVKVIGLDADDTLWVNETFFREAEDKFCGLMSNFETENKVRQELFKVEMQNLEIYGYGIKGFILSMMECALLISNNKLEPQVQQEIIQIGKDMLNKPVDLLETVQESLKKLSSKYRLLLLTKGDLLDQERKLEKSGLIGCFHHVEILSNKYSKNYKKLLDHLNIRSEDFLMVGNSLKSDVLPLLELNAKAVHIPFHITWDHEKVEDIRNNNFLTMRNLGELVLALEL